MSGDEFDVEIDPLTAAILPQRMPDAPEADPDEEPPEPEGHPMSKEVADWLGTTEHFHGPLPHDVAAVWASPPMRVADEGTARMLIAAWGMDGFRGSALHQRSLQNVASAAAKGEVQSRFKAERKKEKKR